MAKKIYCVKVGRKAGIFSTWEECKAQVDGFSGAVYKSFTDIEQARAYVEEKKEETKVHTDKAIAYVDGSYNPKTTEFSCGMVLFYKGDEVRFCKKYDDEELAQMRNVSGEIMGAVSAMRHCIDNNIPALDIYYDYEGIAKWALGDWKTNKKGTISYKKFYDKIKDTLCVNFIKVKGHSGDTYNDLADSLAKQALGL